MALNTPEFRKHATLPITIVGVEKLFPAINPQKKAVPRHIHPRKFQNMTTSFLY